MNATNMPFGKYKGLPLAAVPSAYLSWLDGLPDLREPLRSTVARECERRFGRQQAEDGGRNDEHPDPELAEELIGAGVRSLAKRYHPDAGGSTRGMQHVNAAAAWLRSQVRRLSA